MYWIKKCIFLYLSLLASTAMVYALPPNHDKTNPSKKQGGRSFPSILDKQKAQFSKRDAANRLLVYDAIAINPYAKDYVVQYTAREKTAWRAMQSSARVQAIFKMYDRILTRYNIPIEMKYLSVIESGLNPTLVSSAGAVGPWQLMDDEAARYNLLVGGRDYRTDFEKSTIAACKLINSIYPKYKDWLLTIAAYNAGMGRVNQSIKKAGSRDYWKVQQYLPQETKNHIKRFIATHYFFEGKASATTMTHLELQAKQKEQQMVKSAAVPISTEGWTIIPLQGIYHAKIVAKYLNINPPIFNEYNPDFNKTLSKGKTFHMKIPAEKRSLFIENRDAILQESLDEWLN